VGGVKGVVRGSWSVVRGAWWGAGMARVRRGLLAGSVEAVEQLRGAGADVVLGVFAEVVDVLQAFGGDLTGVDFFGSVGNEVEEQAEAGDEDGAMFVGVA